MGHIEYIQSDSHVNDSAVLEKQFKHECETINWTIIEWRLNPVSQSVTDTMNI